MAQTALYRFYDKDGRLLYVGVTDNIKDRWATHARTKAWWSDVASHTIDWFETRKMALAAEMRTIAVERPAHNIVYMAGRAAHRRALLKGRKVAAEPPALPLYKEILARLLTAGETKTWLSRTSGVSRGSIDNLAKQPRPPYAGTVVALADTLGIDRDEALRLAGVFAAETTTPPSTPLELHEVSSDVLVAEINRLAAELRRRIPE